MNTKKSGDISPLQTEDKLGTPQMCDKEKKKKVFLDKKSTS